MKSVRDQVWHQVLDQVQDQVGVGILIKVVTEAEIEP